MKFELNGRIYTTRSQIIEYADIETKNDNGEDMFVYFRELPMFPSLTDIVEFMQDKGAKVVSE